MACRQCHLAKVKCDRVFPCSRCQRLNLHCTPHKSNQGKGRKRKYVDPLAPFLAGEDTIAKNTPTSALNPDHYGVSFMIRSWISIAFRRRSFTLLEKACSLANRSKISMDKILCGEEGGEGKKQRATGVAPESTASSAHSSTASASSKISEDSSNSMEHLLPIFLTKKENQQVSGTPLSWLEVPKPLLEATGNSSSTDNYESQLDGRWIFIRETKEGMARYFVSRTFDKDIASWMQIQQCWEQNEKEVLSLFLPGSETPGYFRTLAHQISLYSKPHIHPSASKTSCKIMLRNGVIIDVSVIFCLCIVNLNHSFAYHEYSPKDMTAMATAAAASATVRPASDIGATIGGTADSSGLDYAEGASSTASLPTTSSPPANPPLLLLDGLKSSEIDDFLNLLKGSDPGKD